MRGRRPFYESVFRCSWCYLAWGTGFGCKCFRRYWKNFHKQVINGWVFLLSAKEAGHILSGWIRLTASPRWINSAWLEQMLKMCKSCYARGHGVRKSGYAAPTFLWRYGFEEQKQIVESWSQVYYCKGVGSLVRLCGCNECRSKKDVRYPTSLTAQYRERMNGLTCPLGSMVSIVEPSDSLPAEWTDRPLVGSWSEKGWIYTGRQHTRRFAVFKGAYMRTGKLKAFG